MASPKINKGIFIMAITISTDFDMYTYNNRLQIEIEADIIKLVSKLKRENTLASAQIEQLEATIIETQRETKSMQAKYNAIKFERNRYIDALDRAYKHIEFLKGKLALKKLEEYYNQQPKE